MLTASHLGNHDREVGEKEIRYDRLIGGEAPVIAWRSWLSRISDYL